MDKKSILYLKSALIAVLLLFTAQKGSAQCGFRNTAFSGGEYLTYNLYFNWKFVWVKAGTASMYSVTSTYNGKKAYRTSLTTRGNARADKMFLMRDTLLSYSTLDLAPLYYRKGAHEGKRYTVDEVFYSYPNGKAHVRQHRQHNDGTHSWIQRTYEDCVFDMLNVFQRARSFDPSNWKKGYVVKFPMVDGDGRTPAQIAYRGMTTIKGDNGKKYKCLELSYKELTKGKYKEIARFYVTNDKNHIPVRIDMYLRFGSAKAFLVSMKGNRNPVTSIVK